MTMMMIFAGLYFNPLYISLRELTSL